MASENFATGLLAEELHQAVESGSFNLVPALAKAYGQAVTQALYRASSFEDRTYIADQACSFLQDRLHLARVMRAHISAQIASACRLASYGSSPSVENSWCVNG